MFHKWWERSETYNGVEFKTTIFVSLKPFVPYSTNVPTINPNACDRNNLNPNVRPVFWDTSVCVQHTHTAWGNLFPLFYISGENVCSFVFLLWQNCYLPTNRAISQLRAVMSVCSELWRNGSFNQSIPCEIYQIIKRLQSL